MRVADELPEATPPKRPHELFRFTRGVSIVTAFIVLVIAWLGFAAVRPETEVRTPRFAPGGQSSSREVAREVQA